MLGLCFLSANSQVEETFFDHNWRETTPDKGRFFRHSRHSDSGWVVQDYYLPKKSLQMKGLYLDSAKKIMNGYFYFFYPNGQLSSAGVSKDGKKQGTWLSFHPNGFMSDSTVYDESGRPTGISLQWHSNGYVSDSTSYTGFGAVQVSWFDNGNVSSAGRVDTANHQIGKWQYFHRNGKLSASEVYDGGVPVSVNYFDEAGAPVADTSGRNRDPQFAGGVAGWLKYLGNHLYWPANYTLVNGDLAGVGVRFRVDEEGAVKDVFITVPFDEAFNDIVIRTIRNSPKWQPALSHNRRVAFQHRQIVNFQQQR